MQKIIELERIIKPLIDNGFLINDKYKLGNQYGFEKMGDSRTIQLTMKNTYYDKRSKSVKKTNLRVLDRAFRKLVKDTGAEVLIKPSTDELGWEDSLRLLYHHYPYGEGNFTNCILVNGQGRLIAIQYNGSKHTRELVSDVTRVPDYIVLNNCKKLSGQYHKSQYNNIESILIKLFGKNEGLQ